MGRTLIAVTTCHVRRHQADAQRLTWVEGVSPELADVRFFLGPGQQLREDEVILPVDDSYIGLPEKVKATMGWAREHGYTSVLKLDDDTYTVPKRLFLAGYESYDYVGNFRCHNGKYPADYASGFAYWLSAKAMGIIADAPLTDDTFEDRWVGNVLGAVRPYLKMLDDKRFTCTFPTGIESAQFLWSCNIGKTHICFAQYPAREFGLLHAWYKRCYENG
jgi:hypothetical protein